MNTAASLPIVADRVGPCVRDIFFEGLDLTGVQLALEARLNPETPGPAPIALGMGATANAEGLRLIGVTTVAGVPVSQVTLRINETTMEDAAKFPYAGELGTASGLFYDLIGIFGQDKRRLCYGELVALPTVYGMDNAPADRPVGYGSRSGSYSTWTSARLTFGNGSTTVRIDGADLMGAQVQKAALSAAAAGAQADRAEQAADAVADQSKVVAMVPGPNRLIVRYASGALYDGGIGQERPEPVWPAPNADAARWRLLSGVAHKTIYGQSNSRGSDTVAISTTAYPYAYMFKGGTMPDMGIGANRTPIYDAIQPLREYDLESPASGFARYEGALLEWGGVDLATFGRRSLVSSDGEGGLSTTARLPGTSIFDRLKASVSAAAVRAAGIGEVGLSATLYELGGESDIAGGQPTATYEGNVKQMRDGLKAQATAASSGVARDVLVVLAQCSNVVGANPAIPLHQLLMCETQDDFVLSCPLGVLPHSPLNASIHLNEVGAFVAGAYGALSEYLMRYHAHKLMPLVFTAPVKTSARTMTVSRKYPGASLAIEARLQNPGGLGFSIWRPSTGSYLAGVTARIVGASDIEVRAGVDLNAGDVLRYGHQGVDGLNGYGCIRDTSGEHLPVLQITNGSTWAMHQYAPIQTPGAI